MLFLEEEVMSITSQRSLKRRLIPIASLGLLASAAIAVIAYPSQENSLTHSESARGITPRALASSPTALAPEPSYKDVAHYTTTIAADRDLADIYYPVISKSVSVDLPIALLLQGALVDKADYAKFASRVASYGFIVVVPNHKRTVIVPGKPSITGFLPEQRQVSHVLQQMALENRNPKSPIAGLVDT
jgi:predicted dienelactone hydrolase